MPMAFVCKRCDYSTDIKQSLLKHYHRQTPCTVTKEDLPTDELALELMSKAFNHHTCDCGKSFTAKTNLYRHKKLCKTQHKVAELEKEIAELKALVVVPGAAAAAAAAAPTHIVTNIQNNVNHISQTNIIVNGLGKENISYITDGLLQACIRDRSPGVCRYMVHKHFSLEHPENHNVRKLTKGPFIDCFDGKEWLVQNSEHAIAALLRNIERELANYVDSRTELNKESLDSFMREVGQPLDWDFSSTDYDFEEDMSDSKKLELKRKIYGLISEYLYRKSKEVHQK